MRRLLAYCLCCLAAGCATPKKPVAIVPSPDRQGIHLPVRFSGYHQAFAFIARREGVPVDADTLFKLAADSTTTIHGLIGPLPYMWIIEPHLYDGGIYDRLRGAQGNGGYYLLRPLARDFTTLDTDHGFELLGIAEGNAFRWSSHNGVPRLITNWHLSAAESPESVYEWNGTFFKPLASDCNP